MAQASPSDGEVTRVFQTLRTLVGGGRNRVLYECRHCGASVDGPGDSCPDCGAAETAQFML